MKDVDIYKNANEFTFITPAHDGMNPRIITELINAWKNGGNLDRFGRVWVDVFYLRQILRTDDNTARYLAGKLPENAFTYYNDIKYIKGPEIVKLIDMRIQNPNTRSRENNLRFSRDTYNSIVDSNEAQLLRVSHHEKITKEKKRLKQRRIRKYSIEIDELTNEPLDSKKCEFSHIRSWRAYPELALDIENGHIVNKETHTIITANGINDEEELYELCIEMNWKTDWYEKYIKIFGSF